MMKPAGRRSATAAGFLHADLDAFYASVEQRDQPALRGRPVIVGGGVVLAASYEAKRRGIRTAMGGREARRRCPDAVVVSPRMEAYSAASKAVFEIFRDITPLVEGISIDEAFLDVRGLWRLVGDSTAIAVELRRRVRSDVGLVISVGVATTKFLAKVASAQSKPDGLLAVEPGSEASFLHPLPVRAMWGVGPTTERRLEDRGIRTIGDLAAIDEDRLTALLGAGNGHHLHALANNRDPRRVDPGRRRRSIGSQRSFPSGGLMRSDAEAVLLEVTDRVTGRMRASGRVGRTIVLRLRYGDFAAGTRSHTIAAATADTSVVLEVAGQLLDGVWAEVRTRGLTKVGLSVTNLSDAAAVQLALPFDDRTIGGRVTMARADQVSAAVNRDLAIDQIRDRFGRSAVKRTALVNRPSLDMPMLPD